MAASGAVREAGPRLADDNESASRKERSLFFLQVRDEPQFGIFLLYLTDRTVERETGNGEVERGPEYTRCSCSRKKMILFIIYSGTIQSVT